MQEINACQWHVPLYCHVIKMFLAFWLKSNSTLSLLLHTCNYHYRIALANFILSLVIIILSSRLSHSITGVLLIACCCHHWYSCIVLGNGRLTITHCTTHKELCVKLCAPPKYKLKTRQLNLMHACLYYGDKASDRQI